MFHYFLCWCASTFLESMLTRILQVYVFILLDSFQDQLFKDFWTYSVMIEKSRIGDCPGYLRHLFSGLISHLKIPFLMLSSLKLISEWINDANIPFFVNFLIKNNKHTFSLQWQLMAEAWINSRLSRRLYSQGGA